MKGMEIEKEAITKLIGEFEDHPLTREIRRQKDIEVLATRKNATEKIQTLKKLQTDIVPKQKKVAELVGRLALLDDERRTVQATINEKQVSLMREQLDIEGEIREQERILFETADPQISDAISFFRDRHEALIRKQPDQQTHRNGSNVFTAVKKFVTFSNAPAIKDSLNYCLACIRELEGMKLTVILDIERIEAMKKAIPASEIMTEFASEKNYPKINTDPRSLFKSDSQMDWEMSKITEKFNKLMGRKLRT